MQKWRRNFASGRRNSKKIKHGCIVCGSSIYLSPFNTHKGSNFCVCGKTLQQVSNKKVRGAI